jgi:sphinganine-1-phosphate aldolase
MSEGVFDSLKAILGDIWIAIVPILRQGIGIIRSNLNKVGTRFEPWEIILMTASFTLFVVWLCEFLFRPDAGLCERAKKCVFRVARRVPFVRNRINAELTKYRREMEEKFHGMAKGQPYRENLPDHGFSEDELLRELMTYKKLADVKWSEGACSGTVYSGDEKITKLMAKVYAEFAWTNPLHADVFPDVRKMEAEVVRMTCNLFHGDPETSCGTMTTGGTESIMMACKAYRDLAKSRGIEYPEMVIPVTAHAAFDKAGSYFGIKVIHVSLDESTRKVNVHAMKRAITSRTCMLVGSAPQFPHGVIDPIQEIGKLGVRYGIPVHVDSCLGGFLVPFMRQAGFDIAPFDFAVSGVTSISADTHKYGYAPKGSSVVMYSDRKYRQYQYFVQPDWPGGIYASPSFSGSRAGAIIAACWATMMFMGLQGYVDATRKVIKTARDIEARLSKVPGVFVYGKPEVSVIAFGSNDFNIYRLSDALAACGWSLNALQFPSSIHLCVTLVHTKPGIADRFIADFIRCAAEIMKDPKAKCGGQAAMYGMAQSIPDRSIVSEIAGSFFDGYYCTKHHDTK